MSSPFDDQPTAATPPPPKRQRRPWWRWNLVTLMAVLFLLVWVRELSKMNYQSTWLIAFSVIALWWLTPFALVATPLTTMRAINRSRDSNRSTRDNRLSDILLPVFRGVSLFLLALSSLHFLLLLWSMVEAFPFWRSSFFGRPDVIFGLLTPLFEFVAAATLFTLTEIAQRLDQRSCRETETDKADSLSSTT